MDEAHNARTPLSFDTLARFRPACILEYTATPTQPPDPDPSNVLYHVSAYELKAEHMIKLPLRLETHGDWKEAIAAAIAKRKELEDLALVERPLTGDYLRPIVLLQAQPKSKRGDTLTVEAVRAELQDQGVSPDWIAIETGEVREVKQWEDEHKRSLFDDTCPIRFIITVAALREGWDCPFAYVLCSVAEQVSSTAVEQILGRVLRLPQATPKQHEALNQSYAFVTSHRFSQAAQAVEGLIRGLEANGFTHFEAQTEIQTQQPLFPPETGPLFAAAGEAQRTPAERGEVFVVPQLAVWVEDMLEPLESDFFLDRQWTIANCDATLTETEFPTHARQAPAVEVDITARGKFTTRFVEDLDQDLTLLNLSSATTVEELVGWLDRHIPHRDLDQADMQTFLLSMVDKLMRNRGLMLDQLSRERFRLLGAAASKVKQHRNEAKHAGYQQMLFSDLTAPIEVSANRVFTFDPNFYPANAVYEGAPRPEKHYYRAIGAMNAEEARCAQLLSTLKIKFWVRNLERRPEFSFWLPTPTDKFYPDFVALLSDDKILVIEYKGEGYMDRRDTDQKRAIGNLWAQRSNGQCFFLLVGADDYEARLRAIAG